MLAFYSRDENINYCASKYNIIAQACRIANGRTNRECSNNNVISSSQTKLPNFTIETTIFLMCLLPISYIARCIFVIIININRTISFLVRSRSRIWIKKLVELNLFYLETDTRFKAKSPKAYRIIKSRATAKLQKKNMTPTSYTPVELNILYNNNHRAYTRITQNEILEQLMKICILCVRTILHIMSYWRIKYKLFIHYDIILFSYIR